MKTQIIDRTTGGSAETFKIGIEGYFWDTKGGAVRKGSLDKTNLSSMNPYTRKDGYNYVYFSPTIPEWFLPSDAKEKKGIELVKCIDSNGQTSTPFLTEKSFAIIERICRDVEGFDLLKCTKKEPDESVKPHEIWYLGHWNDGTL